MIYNTLKAAVVIAALTVAASQWLYSRADMQTQDRVVRLSEPLTTGSIEARETRRAARSDAERLAALAADARLDPCELPARR